MPLSPRTRARLRRTGSRIFLKHPREAGEGYVQHLRFTLTMACGLLIISGALLVHGLVPCLFPRTASTRMHKMYATMLERIARAEAYAKAHAADDDYRI